jgi:glutamine amidotransferase
MKVGVIDYGVGNIGSIMRAVEAVGGQSVLINRAEDISIADCYILPGVGSFSDCAKLLNQGGWTHALQNEVIGSGKPILGICLGMQLLASFGVEGADGKEIPGLGLIPGRVESLRDLGCKSRVPHVGWNDIRCVSESRGVFKGIPDKTDFYFVHSYAFVPDDTKHIIAVCEYDMTVTVAVRLKSIWGIQFHPEKSSRAGFRLLQNFLEDPRC